MLDEPEKAKQAPPDSAGAGAAPAPSHVGAPAPSEPPLLPDTAKALAGTARDLKALRDAVVDAASIGAGLWFSYLFVLLYLFIAVGSVTHKDLFLQSPVRLPFLNVDLPLLGFFWLGPLIFIIVHAYVLLHFVLLAGKVGDFDAELKEQITDEETRTRLRRQLPSNIFVQFLAGPRELRSGVLGFLLRLIAQISLVIGPIALLVFFQLQFLPYHDEAITWWHRIAVLIDIVLLWLLWPSIARGERTGFLSRDFLRVKIAALVLASLVPLLLVTTIATFPDEWLDDRLWKDGKKDSPWRLASLHKLLVAGEVDFASRKPESLWSNRLVLPGFDAIDHTKLDSEAKIEALPETISLRARHLEGAVLIDAKLRKANFSGAKLQHAKLDWSDLRGSKFDCAGSLEGNPLKQCTQLQGASLLLAQLQGASLNGAQLQGAQLGNANLKGASLWKAHLQGAFLIPVHLQGAILEEAELQGAWLNYAQLQGASLDGAQLQGASLDDADLMGASLARAPQLQGASLNGAQLQGAWLDHAQLQGTTLDGAQLQGATLTKVFVWRADARKVQFEDTYILDLETRPKEECGKHNELSTCNWTSQSFNHLEEIVSGNIPEAGLREMALEKIKVLDPQKHFMGEEEMAEAWKKQAATTPTREVYETRLAKIWQEIGCASKGAPYVLSGLLARLTSRSPFDAQSPQPRELAKAFLDEEHCPGVRGLSDIDKATLKAIRDRAPAPLPAPAPKP